MRRAVVIILAAALAGCGGDGSNNTRQGNTSSGPAISQTDRTPTLAPASPRTRTVPASDPYEFEAPFSAGRFVRERMQGRPTAVTTGGLQAIYRTGSAGVVLIVYHFDTPQDALNTVRFTLGSASIVRQINTPYYGPADSFGLAEDGQGGHLAIWSQGEWCFLVRTTDGLDTLRQFLEVFPY